MIREIETSVGIFGKFNDIKLFMRDENVDEIEILAIRLWNGEYLPKGLLGVLTYAQILAVTNIDGYIEV